MLGLIASRLTKGDIYELSVRLAERCGAERLFESWRDVGEEDKLRVLKMGMELCPGETLEFAARRAFRHFREVAEVYLGWLTGRIYEFEGEELERVARLAEEFLHFLATPMTNWLADPVSDLAMAIESRGVKIKWPEPLW